MPSQYRARGASVNVEVRTDGGGLGDANAGSVSQERDRESSRFGTAARRAQPAASLPIVTTPTPDLVLLTPGPLNTSIATRTAMLRDHGSRDPQFTAMTRRVRADLLSIVAGEPTHVAVPLQGSGTFAVEAMLGTLCPTDGKVLVLQNGAYGQRIARILACLRRPHSVSSEPEHRAIDPATVAAALRADPGITHVAVVHCETTTGLQNPLAEIGSVVAAHGRRLLVDAMSSFGVLPIDVRTLPAEAIVAASGKCLEGVPGVGFALVERTALQKSAGRCHSVALDLHDQWRGFEENGQWRFTPPTHVVAALHAALGQFFAEGGQPARLRRYASQCTTLVAGMRALGFVPLLRPELQAPVLVTFLAPRDPAYDFHALYTRMQGRGFALYPGKLARLPSFRIGCIGAIDNPTIERAVDALAMTLRELGVRDLAPAAVAD